MKKVYDFAKGRRGAVIPVPPGKVRITIRIDQDILDCSRAGWMPRAAETTRR
jgi:uncharacterized protein (DUF4415 family)